MAGRVVVLVIDSLGIGALPDAHLYGDSGSHTLDNTIKAAAPVDIPNLAALGIGNIEGVRSVDAVSVPMASYGRMMTLAPAKDTTAGHWELMGLPIDRAFATFPEGFPPQVMERFKRITGYDYLWAKPASGTEIIERLGEEHLRTARLIVYTSADSVFQIAAHEELVPPRRLYEICQKVRDTIADELNIGRVIARPFITKDGRFVRTGRRRDFSMPPPSDTLLDILKSRGITTIGVGKVDDIFAHRGISHSIHLAGNDRIMAALIDAVGQMGRGFFLATLGDFDTLYGHRNDPYGYARALERADRGLSALMDRLKRGDMLIVTADHGCDPTTPSTDHSREYVPLLVFIKGHGRGLPLGTRKSLADVAATVAEYYGVEGTGRGCSFLKELGIKAMDGH